MTIGIAFSVRPTKMWIGFEIDIARRSLTICLLPGLALVLSLDVVNWKR
jgi:hypothetical protein